MTVKTSQKWPCVYIWANSQNRQLTGFDLCSYLPLKFSYNRRVNGINKTDLNSGGNDFETTIC